MTLSPFIIPASNSTQNNQILGELKMNNNQIHENNATETKTSKPKSFEMYKNEDGKTEITFNLPMKFYTGLDVTEAQARGQIRNDIWLALGVLAENIIATGNDLLMNDYDNRLAVMAHGE